MPRSRSTSLRGCGRSGFRHILHRDFRRAREVALLRKGGESVEGVAQIGEARVGGEFDRNRNSVAVHHRDAVAVRADFGGERLDVVAGEVDQNLLRFLLHLFLFSTDKGDDVTDDVHGGDTGVAGTGDGLEGGDDNARDAELLRGPSAMVRVMVEQLGLVAIWPFHPRSRCWPGMIRRWSALSSGTRRGTSRSMRWFFEFETTTWPAWAKACSISVATEASIAEKTSCGALPGLHSSTMRR